MEAADLTQSKMQQRWANGFLRDETVGGLLMIVAAIGALAIANSPAAQWYAKTAGHIVQFPAIDLHMSVAHITADFLLAFFFLIAGAELKHELVLGSLNRVKRAMTPVAGAAGGMLMAALVFTAVCSLMGGNPSERRGWAIPTSTDIAFALAVLAIIGRRSAPGVRVLLLSIAIINDLGSILIIGSAFATTVHVLALVAAGFFVFVWWLMQQLGVHRALAYAPVFLLTWYFMHASGIHATVAGMLLGLATKATKVEANERTGVEQLEHWLRPAVACIAVPAFAFFAAGIDFRGQDVATQLLSPLSISVMCGLALGQPLGVFLGIRLAIAARIGSIDPDLTWRDIAAVACLAGMGFTVALLVADLALPSYGPFINGAKTGILAGVCAATLFALLALRRARSHRESAAAVPVSR